MEIKGIDVSYAQGVIDWNKVKESKLVDFAIIRTGYGRENDQIDKQFENNYKGAKAVGIPVGAYHYSYAVTAEEALKEAAFCLSLLENKQFEYPVFYDIEENKQLQLGKQTVSDMAVAFCGKVEEAGNYAAIYSYASALSNKFHYEKISRFDCWVAHTGVEKPSYSNPYGIWQYSHNGSIPGINGSVDLDIAYKDYPALIKNKKLNGFNVPQKFYSIKFMHISTKGECESIAEWIAEHGYKAHIIIEE